MTPPHSEMFSDYLAGYRMETTEDLQAEKTALKASRTIFQQQGMGSKTLTRDLRLMEERLQAVNYVLRERGYVIPTNPPNNNSGVGTTDFSQIR